MESRSDATTDNQDEPDYPALIEAAVGGNLEALEKLIRDTQGRIFNLALRFLWSPEDAEDATQEILIRITTNLNTFRGDSSFKTWTWRIAANYLINVKRSATERRVRSFATIEKELKQGHAPMPSFEDKVEEEMILGQVKTACTHAMLLCLGREYRIVYILGEIFALKSTEAARVLDMTPEAYRKRLSRARESMAKFMHSNCGLADEKNACRCSSRAEYSLSGNRIEPYLNLAARMGNEGRSALAGTYGPDMDRLERLAVIFRTNPKFHAPEAILRRIKDLFSNHRLRLLEDRYYEPN